MGAVQAPFFLSKNPYNIKCLVTSCPVSKKNYLNRFLHLTEESYEITQSEISMKALLFLMSVFLLSACNPEVQKAGESKNDLVKYFKITKSEDPNSLGEGFLIVVHVGEKRVLSYYLKNERGYSHTDITIKPGDVISYVLDSVYSQTPNCKLHPSFEQPQYLQVLHIEGNPKLLNLEELSVEEAMKTVKNLSC